MLNVESGLDLTVAGLFVERLRKGKFIVEEPYQMYLKDFPSTS